MWITYNVQLMQVDCPTKQDINLCAEKIFTDKRRDLKYRYTTLLQHFSIDIATLQQHYFKPPVLFPSLS